MKHPLLGLGAFLLMLSPFLARAAEPDPIEERLEKAKAAYVDELEKVKQGLLDLLQKKEDTARAEGKKSVVDQVKAERDAFETKAELPKIVTTAPYQQGLKRTRTVLEEAYNLAIKEYTKAKMDAKASALEQELKALKEDKVKDEFQPGTVWSGTQEWRVPKDSNTHTARFKLTVLERDGNTFKARAEIPAPKGGGTTVRDVKGVTQNGVIRWSAADVVALSGTRGKDMGGTISGNRIVLQYGGKDADNASIGWGVVRLSLDTGSKP
jgi:hypothetical protein